MKRLSVGLRPIPALLRRGLTGAATLLPGIALANPSGGQVVSGSATITKPSSNGEVITEGTSSAIINWQSFSIGANEYVQFIQPSSSSVILNRVIGNSPSSIFGSMTANGRVFLINPDGVLFAPGSSVDVGALVASTVDISNSDFLAGHYVFANGKAGTGITSEGSITAHNGGFVVLNGDYVHNSGVIQAKLGEVVLASGSAMTLSMDQGSLIGYSVDKAALSKQAGVSNSGELLADGGHIIMTAEVAHNLVSTAINNTGLVRAQGISQHDGVIELTANGGDIVDSGTLDASSTAGNGGNVQLRSDNNIELQSGAVIDASGKKLGGAIQVVAGGNMSLLEGALIEGSATAKGGIGGTAELSGHGKFSLAGDVRLGEGGTLTIDPTDITIANGSGTDNTSTGVYFEQSLESTLAGGTSIVLTATNSITLDSLADGFLDGRGTGSHAGNGGSLTMQISGGGGTIQFQNPANTIEIDGNLTLSAGSTTGVINVGNLSAGNISLTGGTSVTTGKLTASAGSLSIAGGAVTTGSIDVQNKNLNTASLSISSSSNVTVNGTITVAGGGGHGTFDSGSATQVRANIDASGNVTVTGNVSLTADPFTRSSNSGSVTFKDTTANANLTIQGNKVSLAGVSVTGVGRASVDISAAKSIAISSDVNVIASRASDMFVRSGGGSSSINDGGDATVVLHAINSSQAAALGITTHGLTATGPNAGILVTGGSLNLGKGASGVAVSATALTGGTSTGGSGAYYQHSYGGGSANVATDYGAAAVSIDRIGSGTTKTGSISVSGPVAMLQLLGSGGVTTVTGNISVQASGYTITGSASQFPAFRHITVPLRGLNSVALLLEPPVLLDGTTHWGTAQFTAGGSDGGTGDTINISGGVTVSGLGQADVIVNAAGLTVGGALSVTANKGSLQGVNLSNYSSTDGGYLGSMSRSISNSAGTGAATIGQANVTVNIGNSTSDVSIGSLSVRGLSAQASFQGGRNLSVAGDVTVDGLSDGQAPDYKEVTTLNSINGGTINEGTTTWVGDNNFLKIGGVSDPAGTVTLGDVSVSGYGFVNLLVSAGTISLGNVTLTQSTGVFTSNDRTRYSSSYSVTNPGTSILLSASSGPATATSLTIKSAGPLAQSLNASITNSYSVTAPSYSPVVSGVIALQHPLFGLLPTSSGDALPLPASTTLTGVTVSATDISLKVSGNLTLSTQSLAASDKLTIQSGGTLTLSNPSLTGSNSISLTGQTVSLNSGLSLTAANLSIDATAGNLSFTNNVLDASSALSLTASGSISATNSELLGDTTTITGPGGITITNSTIAGAGGTTPSTSITLTASSGAITGAGSTLVEGVTVDMVGGGFVSNVSGGFTPEISATDLTLDATGSTLDVGPSVTLDVGGNLLLESQTGSVTLTEAIAAGGSVTIDATTTGTSVSTVAIDAGGALNIAASGSVTTGNIQVGLGSTGQALVISGSQIKTGNIVNNTPTGTIGTANDMSLTATAGSITTGNITTSASGSTTAFLGATATGGGIKTGNISVEGVNLASTGNITLGTVNLQSPTPPQSTIASSAGTVTLASLSGDVPVSISGAGNVQITGATATSGAVSITSSGGSITTGDITGASSIDLASAGTISVGNLSATATTQHAVSLSAQGNISAGSINANGMDMTSQSGNLNAGDLTIGSGDLGLFVNSEGVSITVGNVSYGGDAAYNPTNISFTTGNFSANSISITQTGGSVSLGNLTATGGITLALTGTSLSMGNAAAGTDLSIKTDGALAFTNQILTATGNLDLEGDSSLSATNATITGSTIALTSNGAITINNSLLSGGSIAAVSEGGAIDITHSALGGPTVSGSGTAASLIALSANGGDLTLDNATALNGDAVGLFASDSISGGSNAASSINAGALSVQALNTIDLTNATLTIGSGVAQFGIDSNLLQQINAQGGGNIPVPGSGPNAAFKAQVVNLGTIQTATTGADLYLYVESQATSSGLGYSIAQISNAGDALLNYNLYSGDTQVVNTRGGVSPQPFATAANTTPTTLTIDGAVNAPAGLTTLVIGSSTQSTGIVVNPDAVFTTSNPATVNLVFATSGSVTGASNLHTTGFVLVLNQIASTTIVLPITPGDYTPPSTGTLGDPQSAPQDPDDPGVNSANEGTIVQQSSTQSALTSCGGT